MNLIKAKKLAASLGVEVRYPRRTGEVLFVAPVTGMRQRQDNRRKDATRKVNRLLNRAKEMRLAKK